MHVDDLADACFFLLKNFNEQGLVNIGCGTDISIKELAEMIMSEVGYEGELSFDKTKPDGTPRKLIDTSKLNNLGWRPNVELRAGIRKTIQQFENLIYE